MSQFKYITSFDELTWTIDYTNGHIVRCKISWDARPELVNWFKTSMQGDVSCWNGTSGADSDSASTLRNIIPSDDRCYLIFDNEQDLEMFLLRYSDKVEAKYFGNNFTKIWLDSRRK